MSAMPKAYQYTITPLIGEARGILERGEPLAHIAFVDLLPVKDEDRSVAAGGLH
jgi:hypothetical protein